MTVSTPSPGQTAADRNNDVLVRTNDITKCYGRPRTLGDVFLDVHHGETIAVIGASEPSKSTLYRIVNRPEPIQEGQTETDGIPLPQEGQALAQLHAEVGMIFQSFNLFPHRTALDNITLAPIKVYSVPRGRAEERARELLAQVGLEGQADRCPSQLFGDQQQRVTITRALATDPKLMFFDEPIDVLDPEMINEALDVIRDLVVSGMTMLIVTHEVSFAHLVADWVVFMGGDQTTESGRSAGFFSSPRTGRVRDFLSKMLSH